MSNASTLAGFTTAMGAPTNLNVGVLTARSISTPGSIGYTDLTISGDATIGKDLYVDRNSKVTGVSTALSGLSLGAGSSVFSPEANTVSLGSGNLERVRVLGDGKVIVSTSGTFSAYVGDTNFQITDDTTAKLTLNNPGNSTYSLGVGVDNDLSVINESQTRTDLTVEYLTGNIGIASTAPLDSVDILVSTSGKGITLKCLDDKFAGLDFKSNRSSSQSALGVLRGYWDDTKVCQIGLGGGDDTTNKDDGIIQFFTSPNTSDGIQERMRIDSGGNVKIGTTNNVTFGSRRALTVANGTTGAVISLYNNTTATANPRISSNPSGSEINDIGIHAASTNGNIIAYTNNDTERLRITSAGQVGIGTDNPVQRLHLNNPTGVDVRMVLSNSVSGATNSDGCHFQYNNNDFYIDNKEAGFTAFVNNGGERVRITANGVLTVGAANSTGDERFRCVGNNSGETGIFIQNTNGATNSSADLWFGNWNGSTTTTPQARISAQNKNVNTAATDLIISIYDGSNTKERMRIDADGGVGINTATVAAGVNVAVGGTIRVQDSTDATQYLTISNLGINFQNTGAGSSTSASAHNLNDYEEGTWTPTLITGGTAITVDASNCIYVKVGDMVLCQFEVGALTSANSDNLVLGGLPFNPAQEGTFSMMITGASTPNTDYTQYTGYYSSTASNWGIFCVARNGSGWSRLTGSLYGTASFIGTITFRSA